MAENATQYDAVESAEIELANAKARKESAQTDLTGFESALKTAKNSFFIGRKKRVAAAEEDLRKVKRRIQNALSLIEVAAYDLEEAKENIPIVLE